MPAYLKSNWLTTEWISLEYNVDQSLEGPECSPINRLDAVVGQQEISQRHQTAKGRRRQPRYAVVPQVEPCQPAQSTKCSILDVDDGVARQIQVDK